jgi:hypothetical protein
MSYNQLDKGGKVKGYGSKGERLWEEAAFKVNVCGSKGERIWE